MNIRSKTTVLALLLAAAAGQVQADGWHGHGRHGFSPYRPAPARVHGSGWVAPLVMLGIAGVALSAASQAPATVVVPAAPPPLPVQPVLVYPQPSSYAPPPVYLPADAAYVSAGGAGPTYAAAPQLIESAPDGIAYYCPSYGQYHPQVQSCPGGWQLVALRR